MYSMCLLKCKFTITHSSIVAHIDMSQVHMCVPLHLSSTIRMYLKTRLCKYIFYHGCDWLWENPHKYNYLENVIE